MKSFTIYQVNKENARHYGFTGLYMLNRLGLKVELERYDKVYTGEIEDNARLDDIYIKFNINHPEDFKGHSLSVSDIVEMDGKFYFCDDFGWEEISFQPAEAEAEAEAEADPYEGLAYSVTKINRNFRIKVAGLVDGCKVNTLVGVSGLMQIVQDIALTNRLLDRAFQSVDDKCVCKLRRGVKITFYVA